MLNIISHKGNENQNHSDIPYHNFLKGYFKKEEKKTTVGKDVNKLEPWCIAVGMQNGSASAGQFGVENVEQNYHDSNSTLS